MRLIIILSILAYTGFVSSQNYDEQNTRSQADDYFDYQQKVGKDAAWKNEQAHRNLPKTEVKTEHVIGEDGDKENIDNKKLMKFNKFLKTMKNKDTGK